MQISRLGFLALLWWFIFRALATIRQDTLNNNATLTKSRLSQATASQLHDNQTKSYLPSHRTKLSGTTSSKQHDLVIIAGPLAGDRLALASDSIFIGRSQDCTIILNDDFISPVHAKLSKSGEQWYLEDLGSTNGTFLDKSRISSSVLVPLFTPIRMGKTVFELQS